MNELISVIVSTYNRADALDVVLRSLSRQSDRNFEIVVADDGSNAATADVVDKWAARAGVRIKHVWHDDRGFRLSEIRNLGDSRQRRKHTMFSSMAIALHGVISSLPIAILPRSAGSSPAPAFCSPQI